MMLDNEGPEGIPELELDRADPALVQEAELPHDALPDLPPMHGKGNKKTTLILYATPAPPEQPMLPRTMRTSSQSQSSGGLSINTNLPAASLSKHKAKSSLSRLLSSVLSHSEAKEHSSAGDASVPPLPRSLSRPPSLSNMNSPPTAAGSVKSHSRPPSGAFPASASMAGGKGRSSRPVSGVFSPNGGAGAPNLGGASVSKPNSRSPSMGISNEPSISPQGVAALASMNDDGMVFSPSLSRGLSSASSASSSLASPTSTISVASSTVTSASSPLSSMISSHAASPSSSMASPTSPENRNINLKDLHDMVRTLSTPILEDDEVDEDELAAAEALANVDREMGIRSPKKKSRATPGKSRVGELSPVAPTKKSVFSMSKSKDLDELKRRGLFSDDIAMEVLVHDDDLLRPQPIEPEPRTPGAPGSPGSPGALAKAWVCLACTFKNDSNRLECSMCGSTPGGASPKLKVGALRFGDIQVAPSAEATPGKPLADSALGASATESEKDKDTAVDDTAAPGSPKSPKSAKKQPKGSPKGSPKASPRASPMKARGSPPKPRPPVQLVIMAEPVPMEIQPKSERPEGAGGKCCVIA